MALNSITQLVINNTVITSFKKLVLEQEIDSHQTITVECRMDVLEKLGDELANSSKEFLGETLSLEINALQGFEGEIYKTLEFKGVVTEVRTIKGHEISNGDRVVITAKSMSYITDDGGNYTSFNDVSLSEIIEKTFEGYDRSKINLEIRPDNDITLHYSVQHNESAYEYVKRLSKQYGHWFYYDGTKIIFGEPGDQELTLTYGQDLKEYQVSLIPKSNNYKLFANDYLTDAVQEKSTSGTSANLNSFGNFVSEKSSKIYTKETKIWHNLYNDGQVQQRLDNMTNLQKKAIDVQQVKVYGVCDNPGVKIGNIVKIEGNSYRIIKVTHVTNQVGDYQNSFEAITAGDNVYPFTNLNAFPQSKTQTAIVKENNDPEGLGRVRVQFHWQQSENELTPWLRMVNPHGGGDKGFYFVPEIEEQVLIGFEGDNAEHPYVLGTLYNGSQSVGAFNTQNNDLKVIKTRSGHTIELNDAESAEKITITDKNSNIITIDTANNNIEISALENMTFNAKNMQINVQENLDISVGENKNESIGKRQTLTAKNSTILIDEKAEMQSKVLEKNAEKVTINSTKENFDLSSAKQVVSNSSEKNILI